MKNLFVIGTRPEFIKIAPLANKLGSKILFTNQHFSKNMSTYFFNLVKNCEIIKLKNTVNLMQSDIKDYIKKINPNIVTVQGDTNSTLMGAVATKSLNNLKLYYLESGIRNYDLREIEETNRILTSSISDINFANHANNKKNLIKENITGKIYITGSTVYSSLLNQGLIDEDTKSEDYILITLHRPINVDNIDKLNKLLRTLDSLGIKFIFPIHPRTEKNLKSKNFKNIEFIKPLSYKKFIKLLKNSKMVISDSGGLQEECVIFRKPLVIPLDNPIRPELVNKFNVLIREPKYISKEISSIMEGTSVLSKIQNIDNNIYGKEEVIDKLANFY